MVEEGVADPPGAGEAGEGSESEAADDEVVHARHHPSLVSQGLTDPILSRRRVSAQEEPVKDEGQARPVEGSQVGS